MHYKTEECEPSLPVQSETVPLLSGAQSKAVHTPYDVEEQGGTDQVGGAETRPMVSDRPASSAAGEAPGVQERAMAGSVVQQSDKRAQSKEKDKHVKCCR